MAWILFAFLQLIDVVFQLIGLVLMIPLCYFQAWHGNPDRWNFEPLNVIYGNYDIDGVSGTYAQIWDGGAKVPYMPNANPKWRAYCWNARNRTGGLKYLFRWRGNGPAPFIKGTWLNGRREYKLGWQKESMGIVPVLSL